MTKDEAIELERQLTNKVDYLTRWGGRSAESPEILFLAQQLLEVVRHIKATVKKK